MIQLFTRWPIWVKLTVTFVIAVLIPTLVALFFVQTEIRSVDLRNLENYITERGQDRQQQVEAIFETASSELDAFAGDLIRRGLLVTAIRRVAPQDRIDAAVADINLYIDRQLVSLNVFSTVRVLDLNALVVLSSGELYAEGRVSDFEIGEDQSASLAYQEGLTLLDLQESQELIVDEQNGETVVEIVQTIGSGETILGFVVGTVNIPGAIQPLLTNTGSFVETYSYLLSNDGQQVIAPDAYREQIMESVTAAPLEAATSRETGLAVYDAGDQRLMGYYTTVEQTPFTIVTEADANTSFTLNLVDIYNQGPILLLVMIGVGFVFAVTVNAAITPALQLLSSDIQALSTGDFNRPVRAADRYDEIGDVARSLVNMRDQFQAVIGELENRLQARSGDLEATQEVSRFAATQRDLRILMDRVVSLVVQRFPNIYHAQVFLLDDERHHAVLRASTGEAGSELLKRGHRLAVGGMSVIGQATGEGRVVVARDTASGGVHRRNEFLPDTRAELAIPLQVGDTVIGALDVQSTQSDSFTDEQIEILQTMADQIAIAIANARMYEESMRRLSEIEATNQEMTRRAWQDHMNYYRQQALIHEAGTPTNTTNDALRDQAVQSGKPAVGAPTAHNTIPFVVPIQLRGQTLGAVEWEIPVHDFSQDKVMLAQELVNRLAFGLDNARLFQESRLATDRERLVNEITAQLTQETNIDAILQTAVREVGKALRVPMVDIELNWGNKANGHNTTPDPSTEVVAEDNLT